MKVLVLSDIHGNADALEAVLEDARDWDELWVLGDLVDYGPEPHVVIDAIRGLSPSIVIRGNHDHAVAFGVDCRCDPRIHELSVYTRKTISMKLIGRDQVKWLASLPLKKELIIGDKSFYIVHGSPYSPLYGYIRPGLSDYELARQLSRSGLRLFPGKPKPLRRDFIVVGHTHIPWRSRFDGITLLNPGSVGQPRDGIPRASYMVIDTDDMRVEHRRVSYNIDRVLGKLRSLGIEDKYYTWLKRILLSGKL